LLNGVAADWDLGGARINGSGKLPLFLPWIPIDEGYALTLRSIFLQWVDFLLD